MTQPRPNVTARAIRPLLSGLDALRVDPVPLLAAVGIEMQQLDDPEALVPMSAAIALLHEAEQATGDRDIGLHLAERSELSSFDVLFYAMSSSATLGDAYRRMSRYQRLIHETTRVDIEVAGDLATLSHSLPGGLAVPRHSAEFILASWVRAGRLVTGVDWQPRAVQFAHGRPDSTAEHDRFFRCPLHFAAGRNAVELERSLLALPCTGADPGLAEVLERYARDRLDKAPATSSMSDRARAVISAQLPDGDVQARQVAAALNVSVRTLNRALASEDTSYRALLDQLRHELAVQHLREGRLSSTEIAYMLGFSELSAFYRAFKRWTGSTPAEVRGRRTAAGN